jgi:uridine kinase
VVKGDKLVIKEHHTTIAKQLFDMLTKEIMDKCTISVGGESGAGKSEIAAELARILNDNGIETKVIQQDDYFVYPPRTNHRMRKKNIEQVGEYEVKLDFIEANLRSFKQGDHYIYKPLVIYEEDRITTELLEVGSASVLIAEGTYTTRLNFVDRRIFIDRTYHDTERERLERRRDQMEDFLTEVLEIEHRIVSGHKGLAHVVIRKDFSGLEDLS